MPAPIKHGVRAFLRNGDLPAGCEHIRREVSRLERCLDEAVLNSRKDFTAYDAALIQSARRHETCYRLLERFLTIETHPDVPTLGIESKLAILRDMRAATIARDKCIKDLNIQGVADVVDLNKEYGYASE